MVATFNGTQLLIIMDPGLTSTTATDIYAAWKQWVATSDNAKYPPAFRTIGGDPLGSGLVVGSYYFLQNQSGWRIRPQEANHELVIQGNLYVEDATRAMTVPTLGGYTVSLRLDVSSLTQRVQSSVIAYEVWSRVSGSIGRGRLR